MASLPNSFFPTPPLARVSAIPSSAFEEVLAIYERSAAHPWKPAQGLRQKLERQFAEGKSAQQHAVARFVRAQGLAMLLLDRLCPKESSGFGKPPEDCHQRVNDTSGWHLDFLRFCGGQAVKLHFGPRLSSA